jgi:hypothetical protein
MTDDVDAASDGFKMKEAIIIAVYKKKLFNNMIMTKVKEKERKK